MTAFDRLAALATCLCAQITEDGSTPTCFCGVIPGEGVVAEYAGNCNDRCGMAWVRMVSMVPMSGVGFANETVGNCGSELGMIVEVGIVRCIEAMPTAVQLLAAADQQFRDAYTMQRAIVCCPELSPKDYLLGEYTPTGPLGGLVGGTWQVTMI